VLALASSPFIHRIAWIGVVVYPGDVDVKQVMLADTASSSQIGVVEGHDGLVLRGSFTPWDDDIGHQNRQHSSIIIHYGHDQSPRTCFLSRSEPVILGMTPRAVCHWSSPIDIEWFLR
jgi:hypothetical protein